MATIRGFWQHENGKMYAIESTTFGEIIGAVGPLPAAQLLDLDAYDYKPAIVDWLKTAISQGKLHRISPPKS